MSFLHPNIKLPLWAAIAIPAAAYLYRSVVRGFDFRPDLPADGLAFALYVLVLAIVVVGRRAQRAHELEQKARDEEREEDS